MTRYTDLIRRGDAAERKRRKNIGDHHTQMMDAQAQCVPCRLCGGKAVITDAGPGFGYTIECENAARFRKPTCLQSGTRISGWAYNVSDVWNRLNAHPVQEPPSPGVTAGATGVDDDPPCTDCGGTGITYQTERRCACQGPVEAWLIHKAGRGWYRPDAQGYTGNPAKAGRYSYEDAYRHSRPNGETGPRDGITIKRASEVLATPAPVVPAEGLDALQRRAYSWQVEHEQGPDTFRDVRNNPAHAHEMLESAHVLIDDLASALRSAPPVGARVKPLAAVFDAAQAEAEKAMRKFPQPNYVISKVAEEAGEVVKAAIHCAENRETKEAVLGEVVQCMAMLIRLCLEGDQVHGLAALLPAGEGE